MTSSQLPPEIELTPRFLTGPATTKPVEVPTKQYSQPKAQPKTSPKTSPKLLRFPLKWSDEEYIQRVSGRKVIHGQIEGYPRGCLYKVLCCGRQRRHVHGEDITNAAHAGFKTKKFYQAFLYWHLIMLVGPAGQFLRDLLSYCY